MKFRDGVADVRALAIELREEWIPELAGFFRSCPDATQWNWLGVVSDMSVAAAFSKMFWPDFTVHESGIFLRELFTEESYLRWKTELNDDIKAIEKVMNHVHLWDLFVNPRFPDPDERAVRSLAAVLGQLWSLKARQEFGAGRVVVEVVEDDADGPTLFLYQESLAGGSRGAPQL